MGQDQLKREVAKAALRYVPEDSIVGVGTGSTVNFFIDELAAIAGRIKGAVSSSEASTKRLEAAGISVHELNDVGDIPIYVDGADETDGHRRLIKGGGGALTREKICAAASARFVCIVDQSKVVKVLGRFPLPIEVIPMARSMIARKIVAMGGIPEYREGFVTDNGNQILDVRNLKITDPSLLEQQINDLPGVVTVGLFSRRPADVVLVAGKRGVTEL